MNTIENKRPLMKHFASVLRRRALATTEVKEIINPQILNFFSRKDLIEIIKDKYDGTIPKKHDLIELENRDLLSIIEDDIYIISFMTKKWSKEQSLKVIPDEKGMLMQKMDEKITKVVKKSENINTIKTDSKNKNANSKKK